MPKTSALFLFLAGNEEGIKKIPDFNISMLVCFPADEVHFFPNLLKVIERISIFSKYFIAIVFQAKMCQVYHAIGGSAAYSLLHCFRRICEMAAQFMQSSIRDIFFFFN